MLTASARQNPTLTLLGQGVTLPEINNNGGNPYYYSANVSRLFERGQKRKWRMEGADDTAQVTESQLHDQERQLVLSVRQSFTNMLAAKAALAIAEENLTDYRKTVDLSKARLDAGDITRTDYERIDLQLAQFESDDDSARLNMQQASAQLQQLFGVDHPSPSFDVTGTLDLPPITLTMADAETRALAARPDFQAAKQSLLLSQANAHFAVASGTADPTVASEYERSGAANTFGVSVSIPLRIFDRNQGEKERTRYEVESSRLAVVAARNQVVSDVDQAWLALDTAQRQAIRYNTHYLAEAGRVRDNLQFSYRNGNSTLLDYLDALRDYRSIHLSSLNANVQVWLAIHQLSYATATDIIP
jgi:cobalt-zinc-cadmium efflux system outer membrane protein